MSSEDAFVHYVSLESDRQGTPEYRFPEPSPPEETASLDEVVTISPTEAWAWGVHTFNHGEVADEPATEDFLLRWDGSQWKEWQAEPDEVRPGMLASDGAGGLVTDGQHLTSDNELLSLEDPEPVAGRAGTIEKVDREQRLSLNEVVHVSDTDQVWGVGHVGLEAHGDANFRRSVVVSYSTP